MRDLIRTHMQHALRSHCAEQMHVRNGRTNEELLTFNFLSYVSNAHEAENQNG